MTATRMYALRLMYLSTFSRYQRQYLTQHMKNFTTGLVSCSFFVFLSTYSMIARTNCTTATMKDPSAMEPRWYRVVR